MEILGHINWVDVLVIIIILRISYIAFREGLTHEVFPLIGNIIIIVTALHYYIKLGSAISRNFLNLSSELSNFISFVILAVAAGFVFRLLNAFLNKLVKMQWHPLIERFGGLVVGVIRASVITSLVLTVLSLAPLSYLQRSIRDKSVTGVYFLRIGPEIYGSVSRFLPTVSIGEPSAGKEEMIKNIMSDKTISPGVAKEKKAPR